MPTAPSNRLDPRRAADRPPPQPTPTRPSAARRVKHVLDRLLAAFGLLVTAPLIAAVAVALWQRGGPVLAREPRLGEGGRTIQLLSFAITAELRRARGWRLAAELGMATLPQLWNVLRGELSVVGPRPRAIYADPPPTRPGLTGLAQLAALAGPVAERDAMRLDADYARDWSLGLDARIVVRTLLPFAANSGDRPAPPRR